MSPQKKLVLTIILGAIRDQDSELVVTRTDAPRTVREKRAEEALAFVASPDFTYWCNLIGLAPTMFRKMTPQQAKEILQGRIRRGTGRWDRRKNEETKDSNIRY